MSQAGVSSRFFEGNYFTKDYYSTPTHIEKLRMDTARPERRARAARARQDLITGIRSTLAWLHLVEFAVVRIGRNDHSTWRMLRRHLLRSCSTFVTGFTHQKS